jgi:hypothetical protein
MDADRDPSITEMVRDFAIKDLKTLAEELCKRYVSMAIFMSAAMALIKLSISKVYT